MGTTFERLLLSVHCIGAIIHFDVSFGPDGLGQIGLHFKRVKMKIIDIVQESVEETLDNPDFAKNEKPSVANQIKDEICYCLLLKLISFSFNLASRSSNAWGKIAMRSLIKLQSELLEDTLKNTSHGNK